MEELLQLPEVSEEIKEKTAKYCSLDMYVGEGEQVDESEDVENEAYNEWKEKCVQTIVTTYKEEYPSIFQFLKEKVVEEKVIATQDSGNLSTGVVGGIGAAAAAGGAGLAVGGPIAVKSILRLFKVF